jgi:hypothetical protein
MHGDFSTAENNSAAILILREVAPRWKYKTILAGKKPSPELIRAASALRHVKLVPNPSMNQMNELIGKAQVCLLSASQPSGMKLKLINALSAGRHVIASPEIVAGTSLESLCSIAQSPEEWISHTKRLMKEEFTTEMRQERNRHLYKVADNTVNAKRIIESLNNSAPAT